jgi:hypothetical protein
LYASIYGLTFFPVSEAIFCTPFLIFELEI